METELYDYNNVCDRTWNVHVVKTDKKCMSQVHLILQTVLQFPGSKTSWRNFRIMMECQRHCVKSSDRKWSQTALIRTVKKKIIHFLFKNRRWRICFFFFSCNIDNKNISPYLITFLVGMIFILISVLSSFYLKKIEPKKLVCKYASHLFRLIATF